LRLIFPLPEQKEAKFDSYYRNAKKVCP
jgi:hypothetical protein